MKKNKKEINYFVMSIAVFLASIVIGFAGYFIMQKYSAKNGSICNYLGRLWMPDKDKNIPGLHKCYTYEEYYQ